MLVWVSLLNLSVANVPWAVYERVILSRLPKECGGPEDVRIVYVKGLDPFLVVVGDVSPAVVNYGWHRTGQMFHGWVSVVKYV